MSTNKFREGNRKARQHQMNRSRRKSFIQQNATTGSWGYAYLAATIVITAAAFLFDWLQSVEVMTLGITSVVSSVVAWALTLIIGKRPKSNAAMIGLGLLIAGTSLMVSHEYLKALNRSPENLIMTDRKLQEFSHRIGALEADQAYSAAAKLLAERIETEPNEYWLSKWQVDRIVFLILELGNAAMVESDERLESMVMSIRAEFEAYGLNEQADDIYETALGRMTDSSKFKAFVGRREKRVTTAPGGRVESTSTSPKRAIPDKPPAEIAERPPAQRNAERLDGSVEKRPQPAGSNDAATEISNSFKSAEYTKLTSTEAAWEYAKLASTGEFGRTRDYLLEITKIAEREEWGLPIGKWLVDNEVQWSASINDPAERQSHLKKALLFARASDLGTTSIERLMADTEWESKQQPIHLPEGLISQEESWLKQNGRCIFKFSLANDSGEYFTGLASKDVAVDFNGQQLRNYRFARLHQWEEPRQSSVLVMVDHSCGMQKHNKETLAAIQELRGAGNERTVVRFVQYADTVTPINPWDEPVGPELSWLNSYRHITSSDLSNAMNFAIAELSRRNGDRSLVVISSGSEVKTDFKFGDFVEPLANAEIQVFPLQVPRRTDSASRFWNEIAEYICTSNVEFVIRAIRRGMYELSVDLPKNKAGTISVTIGTGQTKISCSAGVKA
ncbi:MAG: hypothetical protein F9B45_20740 [Phycisphaera sp. RhM]|nr:hypothetical protein [Phycisphaera sp. RhM]